MQYEYIINAKFIDCPKCGGEYIVRSGMTEDGRQRIYCNSCKRKTTLNPKPRGQGFSNEHKMLPFLLKPNHLLNEKELYALGWMISDGTISKMNTMCLSIQIRDRAALEIVKDALQIKNNIRTYDRRKEGKGIACVLAWGSKYALEDFKRFGMFTNKTANEVWLPYMESNHFLRGLFDGDGGFSFTKYWKGLTKMNGCAHFCCANLKFVERLNVYLKDVAQVSGSIYQTSNSDAYKVTYSITHAEKLGNFLYKDSEGLRLERKYNKYLEIKNRHMINETEPPLFI